MDVPKNENSLLEHDTKGPNSQVENKDDHEIDFDPSELGTKEYWDEVYKEELDNFTHNGDVGDVWFGEDSVIRVIDWMKSSTHLSRESSILDIGCGNGITLSYLADEGFKNLYGVDYCDEAITLAKAVADKRGTSVQYEVGNITGMDNENTIFQRKYDVCHDKGTYDAITLCPVDAKKKMLTYTQNVYELLKPNGIFIITSCNWTGQELLARFNKYFEKYESIPTPVFMFGGKIGSNVTSLVLKKKEVITKADGHS